MEKIKRFFWLCSGVHIPLLEKCEVDSSRYVGIGATIFFTGLFAAIAASYALFTAFDSIWIASAFGLVWGLMIFNLDRYIVSSMRKEGNAWREFRMALPRIVLAVIISLVIAKPLELKIFEKEINGELVIMEQQTYTAQENEIRGRYTADREMLSREIDGLKAEIVAKAEKRDALVKAAQEEADGTGGTKQRNAGPIYKIKKADADQAESELAAVTQTNNLLIIERSQRLVSLDSTQRAEIEALGKQKLSGPAARMEALSRLTAQSDAIWLANWFIMLLFIAVETAPVFVKLISGQGPYDQLLKIEEHGFEANRIEVMAQINAATKERAASLPQTESTFVGSRLDMRLDQSP